MRPDQLVPFLIDRAPMTEPQLSRSLGRSNSWARNLRKGSRDPKMGTAALLASVFGAHMAVVDGDGAAVLVVATEGSEIPLSGADPVCPSMLVGTLLDLAPMPGDAASVALGRSPSWARNLRRNSGDPKASTVADLASLSGLELAVLDEDGSVLAWVEAPGSDARERWEPEPFELVPPEEAEPQPGPLAEPQAEAAKGVAEVAVPNVAAWLEGRAGTGGLFADKDPKASILVTLASMAGLDVALTDAEGHAVARLVLGKGGKR